MKEDISGTSRLSGRRLVSLDVASLLAGSSYRGEFELRMQQIIREVSSARGGIILFIDEIHQVGCREALS